MLENNPLSRIFSCLIHICYIGTANGCTVDILVVWDEQTLTTKRLLVKFEQIIQGENLVSFQSELLLFWSLSAHYWSTTIRVYSQASSFVRLY